ncbi:hypothetical protein [Falsiroseomonas sp. E2-1-a4]|uniref:hypothetical protein n=1 Tax=Falsiroseomonas sp. E2-1-a4 TaxID=3239299 RepID=UPI003F2D24E9
MKHWQAFTGAAATLVGNGRAFAEIEAKSGEPRDTYDLVAFGIRPHRILMRFRGSEPV